MGVVDAEWTFILAACNRVLRQGMEREAEKMQEIMGRLRAARVKALSKRIVDSAYEAIRDERASR